MQASVFTPAERTTAADREDDRRSVQRRLDAPLRLITQIALGKLRPGLLNLGNWFNLATLVWKRCQPWKFLLLKSGI